MIYYSAEKKGFYSDAVHGAPTMRMIDPEFEWPLIEVPDPDYLGKDVAPVIKVRDESIDPPMINVPNPGCRLPNDVVEITAEEHSELLAGQAGGLRIIADESGYPVLASPPPDPLDELTSHKRRELDAARDEAFASGLEYDFNGETDVVQTRPQDQVNLLGLQAQAQRLIAAGQPEATLTFRGLKNVNRELTATEVEALTLAALGHIEGIYQRSWELKDQLDVALKTEDREGIEQLFW